MENTQTAPADVPIQPTTGPVDVALWAGILLPLLGAASNTMVGFSVAHHACNANRKTSLVAVHLCDLVLTLSGGLIAFRLRQRFTGTEDARPQDGRRLFMASLGTLVACICSCVVIAALIATFVMDPCD